MDDQSGTTRDVSVGVNQSIWPGEADGLVIERRGSHASVRQRKTRPRVRRPCQARLRAFEFSTAKGQNEEHLAVFSHELRGSLGAIRNAAYLLGRQPAETLTAEKARLLIERQVARMTRLTDDLIEVARTGREAQHLRCERIDLCAVVKHALETVQSEIAVRNHRLATSLPDVPVWLQADAGRLEQVLVNLLINAAKYTDQPGDLSLSMEHVGRHAVLRVRDCGIGIAPDVLPHVFDPFMQAEPASRLAAAGLGIGLALVRRLVELHGGSVSATSAGLGRGSEFVVRLPILSE